jgi:hypothetical protein
MQSSEPRNRHERQAEAARERLGVSSEEFARRQKYGWKVNEWSDAVGCSRALTYELIAAQRIVSVKLGKSRLITTHPFDFLQSLAGEAAA